MDQPDLDALEQDVESARVRLAEDITRWRDPAAMSEFKDTVVRKATSIKDEVVREASDTATHTAEGLWSDIQQRARANPWAALAIGAGLAWHLVRHPPISSALIGFGLVSLLRTDRSSAPSPLVTDAVEYAETAKEWAGTANRKIKEWREHAGGQAEEALTRSQEALGRAEELVGETWRTTTEIATRASAFGERAVRDAETRDGLLLGAAVLAVGGALFIALRSNGEMEAEQQSAVTPRRIGGRPDAYRLEDAELELGC
jgi:ElaB/YqjD/DUF883 family membrane-anchored ribosome-binding protein